MPHLPPQPHRMAQRLNLEPPCSLPLLPLPCKVCLIFFPGFTGVPCLLEAPPNAPRPVLPDQPAPSPQCHVRAAGYSNESPPCPKTSWCRLFTSPDQDWLHFVLPTPGRPNKLSLLYDTDRLIPPPRFRPLSRSSRAPPQRPFERAPAARACALPCPLEARGGTPAAHRALAKRPAEKKELRGPACPARPAPRGGSERTARRARREL